MIAHTFKGARSKAFRAQSYLGAAVLEAKARLRRPRRSAGRHALAPAELIVSITSYPPRFPTLKHTLNCLLSQNTRPDRVILWVAEEDRAKLPPAVLALMSAGLEVRTTENLGSYKKIIPARKEFPKAFIVVADDDVYYPATWLDDLIQAYRQGPPAVIAHRAREIIVGKDGVIAPYKTWPLHFEGGLESDALVPTGIGGVLYPPGSLSDEALDATVFQTLSPNGDDLWLFWMARRAGFTCRLVARPCEPITWNGSQHVSLRAVNLSGEERNDRFIRALQQAYGLPVGGEPKDTKAAARR